MALSPDRHGREIELQCEFDAQTLELRPQDLSQAGVFVVTTAPPKLDSELELSLRSPIGSITVRGQVVQVISTARATAEQRSPGFGLLFVDLLDDQRAWIGLTLDALLRAQAQSARPSAAPEQSAKKRTPSRTPPSRASSRAPARRSSRAPVAKLDDAESRARAEQERKLAQRRAQMLAELEQQLASLQNKSAWELLEIEPACDAETAHRAYLAQSKRYHPHVYAHLDSQEINRAATELFIAHKRAYATLASLRPAAPTASQPPLKVSIPPVPKPLVASPRATGERASLRPTSPPPPPQGLGGTPSLAPGPLKPTSEAPARAAQPTPLGLPSLKRRVADTEIALNAGLKHLAASRFDDAATDLARAKELCPERRDVTVWLHVCRARKLKSTGRAELAVQEYRAVLELDPDHREAIEHAGGGRPPRRRGGLIGKLFGTENE